MDSGVKKKRSQAPHARAPSATRAPSGPPSSSETPIEKNGCSVHGVRGTGASGGWLTAEMFTSVTRAGEWPAARSWSATHRAYGAQRSRLSGPLSRVSA